MDIAIITAAGKSTRLKGNISKQFMNIYGKPVLAHTLIAFQNSTKVEQIYVVVHDTYVDYCSENIIKKYAFSKVKKIITGGNIRQESVYNALLEIPSTSRTVSIHDGVRPIITAEEIDYIIDKLVEESKKDHKIKGIIMASPAHETIKRVNSNETIEKTIPREKVWHAQTPQTFFYEFILKAHKAAMKEKFIGTDDSGLVERLGYKVKIVRGRHENIKITTPMDLFLAELIMTKGKI